MALQLGPVIGQIGGGGVEEIPVSMNGNGGSSSSPVPYLLTTVDAGAGALISVDGTMAPGATTSSSRPQLQIGSYVHVDPASILVGDEGGLSARVSGTVQVQVLSRTGQGAFGMTSFTGTVYVAHL